MLTSADLESVRNQLLAVATSLRVQVDALRQELAYTGVSIPAGLLRIQETIRQLKTKITETTNYLQNRRGQKVIEVSEE